MNQICFDNDRADIMRIFMAEAKKHAGLSNGSNPIFSEAIGLVEASVAVEALSNEVAIAERINNGRGLRINDGDKRSAFCSRYQTLYVTNIKVFQTHVQALKKELNRDSLHSMDMSRLRPHLEIADETNLREVIEVAYRVRSNLVHGSKSLSSDRNRVLIGNSFKFLYLLMEVILDVENIL